MRLSQRIGRLEQLLNDTRARYKALKGVRLFDPNARLPAHLQAKLEAMDPRDRARLQMTVSRMLASELQFASSQTEISKTPTS